MDISNHIIITNSLEELDTINPDKLYWLLGSPENPNFNFLILYQLGKKDLENFEYIYCAGNFDHSFQLKIPSDRNRNKTKIDLLNQDAPHKEEIGRFRRNGILKIDLEGLFDADYWDEDKIGYFKSSSGTRNKETHLNAILVPFGYDRTKANNLILANYLSRHLEDYVLDF